MRRLAQRMAPVSKSDVATDDTASRPRWAAKRPAAVAPTAEPGFSSCRHAASPTAYCCSSSTTNRWFPAHPREGRFDYLGGHLDALVWA